MNWDIASPSSTLAFRAAPERQRGVYFHLYFLLLGWLSRVPGLDIPLAYHLGRLFFGALTLEV